MGRYSSDWDDEMGGIIKAKKIRRASNKPQKMPGRKINPAKNSMPNFRALRTSRNG